jgi:hypothetical protein
MDPLSLSKMDPDPHSFSMLDPNLLKRLDPDPHKVNADPKNFPQDLVTDPDPRIRLPNIGTNIRIF